MEYVPTEDNLADLFTKALARPRHESLTSRIGLLEQGGVLELSEREAMIGSTRRGTRTM